MKNISILSLYARNVRNLYQFWLSEKISNSYNLNKLFIKYILCSKGYVRNVNKLFSSTGAELFKLNTHFHCKSLTCLYYLLTCPVCTKNYVGKTANFREIMNNHKTDIQNPELDTIYADKHFNGCITKRFGFLKEPLFYSTPFLYVKDDDKRDRLENII